MGKHSKANAARRGNGKVGGRGKRAVDCMIERPTILGVVGYAGYGGVSRGLTEAGVVPAVLIDWSEDCKQVLRGNVPVGNARPAPVIMRRQLGCGTSVTEVVRDAIIALREVNAARVDAEGARLGIELEMGATGASRRIGVMVQASPCCAKASGVNWATRDEESVKEELRWVAEMCVEFGRALKNDAEFFLHSSWVEMVAGGVGLWMVDVVSRKGVVGDWVAVKVCAHDHGVAQRRPRVLWLGTPGRDPALAAKALETTYAGKVLYPDIVLGRAWL